MQNVQTQAVTPVNREVPKSFLKVKHTIQTASAQHYQSILNLVLLYVYKEKDQKNKAEILNLFKKLTKKWES